MAEETEVQSQPASDARSIVAKHLADYAPEPEGEPQAPVAAAEPEETVDPATITIPDRQFKSDVPKVLEKFKGKNLTEVGHLVEETERWGHTKAQEAAEARKQVAELQARLAAAEQVGRMQPAPAQPVVDRWKDFADETFITDPKAALNRISSEADRIATIKAEAAKNEAIAAARQEIKQQQEAAQIIGAFETARKEVSQLYGEEIPIDRWQQELQYIAPVIMRENAAEPGRMFNPKAYVEHYTRLKGAPQKVSVPAEGNPPVPSKAAKSAPERATSPMSREESIMRKQIRSALNLKD